jgi:hypothetical protein
MFTFKNAVLTNSYLNPFLEVFVRFLWISFDQRLRVASSSEILERRHCSCNPGILYLLSRLPAKYAVKTSLLSLMSNSNSVREFTHILQNLFVDIKTVHSLLKR